MLDSVHSRDEFDKTGTGNGSQSTDYHGHFFLEDVPYQTVSIINILEGEMLASCPILVISSGAIGLQHFLKDGRRSISDIFLAGEILDFRHMGVSNGTLICLLSGEAKLFEAEIFDRFQQKNPHLRAALTANHFRHNRFTASHCVDLALKSATEKLASFIFECRSRQMIAHGQKIRLILKRIDIADYMGLRPETLSRAFTKLIQRKLIAYDDRNHIHILNEPLLRQIANGATVELGCTA